MIDAELRRLIEVTDLWDETDCLVLADALEKLGREESAALLRTFRLRELVFLVGSWSMTLERIIRRS